MVFVITGNDTGRVANMKWFNEIQAVGFKDWFWFVFIIRRNEFHRSLDMDNWKGTPIELMQTRHRAHVIDDKLSSLAYMTRLKNMKMD